MNGAQGQVAEIGDLRTPISAGRRVSQVTFDQVISSASNLLILILVAHELAPIDFGRFSLLFVVYTFGQAAMRSLVSLPVLMHPEDAAGRPRAALGAATMLCVMVGGVCVAGGGVLMALGSAMAPAVVALGACLPLLLIQDVGRYLAIARGCPKKAIVLDAQWLILMIGSVVVADRVGSHELVWLVLAWGGSGAIAGLWVFVQYGAPWGRDLRLDWLRERWDIAWRTLTSNLSSQAIALFAASFVAIVSSPVAVAAVRASLLVGRPSATVQLAIGTSTVADVARDQPDDSGLRKHQRRALAICAAGAVANLVVLLLLPDVIGRAILGNVWALIKPVLLGAGLFGLAAAAQTGVHAVMLGRREVRLAMVVDIIGATLGISCTVAGAAVGAARGAIWGALVGQSIAALIWWAVYLRYLHLRRGMGQGRHRREGRLTMTRLTDYRGLPSE